MVGRAGMTAKSKKLAIMDCSAHSKAFEGMWSSVMIRLKVHVLDLVPRYM